MEEFFSSFLRRAGMPASAGLSCCDRRTLSAVLCAMLPVGKEVTQPIVDVIRLLSNAIPSGV